jgi:hypothetical protein
MKITKRQLKRIIKEEFGRVLNEGYGRDPDVHALATAMWTFMRDSGMRMHVSAEGALPVGRYLVDQIKRADRGEPGDLYRKIPGEHEDKMRIMSRNTIQSLLSDLEHDRVYKVDEDQYIITRRGEAGAVIGNTEEAREHEVRY